MLHCFWLRNHASALNLGIPGLLLRIACQPVIALPPARLPAAFQSHISRLYVAGRRDAPGRCTHRFSPALRSLCFYTFSAAPLDAFYSMFFPAPASPVLWASLARASLHSQLDVDMLRPALVYRLPSSIGFAAPPPPRLTAATASPRPCCPRLPASFESITTKDIARFASRFHVQSAVERRQTLPPLPASRPQVRTPRQSISPIYLPCSLLSSCCPVGASPPPRPPFHQMCSLPFCSPSVSPAQSYDASRNLPV